MSYIIKNCPAILKMTKVCDDYRTTRDNPELCKNINDCVMKQIVKQAGYCLCPEILKLLDIQEVE